MTENAVIIHFNYHLHTCTSLTLHTVGGPTSTGAHVIWTLSNQMHTHTHIPNDDDLIDAGRYLLNLCYEDGSHGLIEGGAIHVDGGSDGQHEPCYTRVGTELLLQAPNGHRQRG